MKNQLPRSQCFKEKEVEIMKNLNMHLDQRNQSIKFNNQKQSKLLSKKVNQLFKQTIDQLRLSWMTNQIMNQLTKFNLKF